MPIIHGVADVHALLCLTDGVLAPNSTLQTEEQIAAYDERMRKALKPRLEANERARRPIGRCTRDRLRQ